MVSWSYQSRRVAVRLSIRQGRGDFSSGKDCWKITAFRFARHFLSCSRVSSVTEIDLLVKLVVLLSRRRSRWR